MRMTRVVRPAKKILNHSAENITTVINPPATTRPGPAERIPEIKERKKAMPMRYLKRFFKFASKMSKC